MWKQKLLVVCLCGLLFVVGLSKNQQSWEAGASVHENKQANKKTVALTFDDGPHCRYTKQLLDGLRERDVKASFFLVGENIPYNKELVKRMAEEGHLIGNHTDSHAQLTELSLKEALDEIEKTNQRIYDIIDQKVEYIRPPYGCWSEELGEVVDMEVVLWNVDPEDWKNKDAEKIVEEVEKYVGDGSVILMHDIFGTSVDAALELIDHLKADGYEFVTVEELTVN